MKPWIATLVAGAMGFIGAVLGAYVSWSYQWWWEKKKRHQETLRRLRSKTVELYGQLEAVFENVAITTKGVYPDDARELARDIELDATNLNDEDLQRRVVRVLNDEYDSPELLKSAVLDLSRELRKEAYPILHDEKISVPSGDIREEARKMTGQTEKWPGPANIHFMNKLVHEGAETKRKGPD
jgi:hypothetical protein